MGEVLLNGRRPLDWELPAIERGRAQELERDTAQLAGVLTETPPPERVARPLAEVTTGMLR